VVHAVEDMDTVHTTVVNNRRSQNVTLKKSKLALRLNLTTQLPLPLITKLLSTMQQLDLTSPAAHLTTTLPLLTTKLLLLLTPLLPHLTILVPLIALRRPTNAFSPSLPRRLKRGLSTSQLISI
jgi:hypothetical protein